MHVSEGREHLVTSSTSKLGAFGVTEQFQVMEKVTHPSKLCFALRAHKEILEARLGVAVGIASVQLLVQVSVVLLSAYGMALAKRTAHVSDRVSEPLYNASLVVYMLALKHSKFSIPPSTEIELADLAHRVSVPVRAVQG